MTPLRIIAMLAMSLGATDSYNGYAPITAETVPQVYVPSGLPLYLTHDSTLTFVVDSVGYRSADVTCSGCDAVAVTVLPIAGQSKTTVRLSDFEGNGRLRAWVKGIEQLQGLQYEVRNPCVQEQALEILGEWGAKRIELESKLQP